MLVMAVSQSLSENSSISAISGLASVACLSIHLEIFLVLGMARDSDGSLDIPGTVYETLNFLKGADPAAGGEEGTVLAAVQGQGFRLPVRSPLTLRGSLSLTLGMESCLPFHCPGDAGCLATSREVALSALHLPFWGGGGRHSPSLASGWSRVTII